MKLRQKGGLTPVITGMQSHPCMTIESLHLTSAWQTHVGVISIIQTTEPEMIIQMQVTTVFECGIRGNLIAFKYVLFAI